MLKSKKAKIIFSALTVLCVLIASSVWVFLSLKSNSVDEFDYQRLAAANASASATMTQIDHIIETSNQASTSTEYDDSCYYIYVIVPSDGAKAEVLSSINPFLEGEDGFRTVIINENRTIAETMAANKVVPVVKTIAEIDALADNLSTELGKADLIYVYAQSNAAYTGGSAISENLYEFLHNYAFGSNKPLIMNYELKNTGADDDTQEQVTGTNSQVYYLTTSDFKNSWKRTYTTNVSNWTKDSTDISDTIQSYMENLRSTYVPYQANNLTLPDGYPSWPEYWKRTGTADPTLNVLVITGDTLVEADVQTEFESVTSWMLDSAAGMGHAFSSISDILPTASQVDVMKAGDITVDTFYMADTAGNSVKKYDYIFITPDAYSGTDITADVRNELKVLSDAPAAKGWTYILFGTVEGATSSGGTGSGKQPENLTIDTTTNFGKLIDLSITTNGYAKKNNVLVVGTQYMQTLAARPAHNPKKVNDIVTLINKSHYRNYAGSGEGGGSGSVSTTAYRVLELQPCYPIDKELAASSSITTNTSKFTNTEANGFSPKQPLGNYYTIPANVLNTSEIDNYLSEDGTMTQEYYQWDLSKAKLAYALGLNAEQIELVQMSTDEYITAKADVSDSYDLIYVGGNMSAFKHHLAYGMDPNWSANEEWRKNEAVFSMYCHMGQLTSIRGARISQGNPYDYTIMNGNDITYDRLTQLEAYIDAGMPIVFSNEIWNAYTQAKKDGYKNVYMDPDCNMFKLCQYAEEADDATTNDSILVNWGIRKQYDSSADVFFTDYWVNDCEETVSNPDGLYGSAENVKVFSDDRSDELYRTVYSEKTSIRPKFTIDTTALTYVEGDSKTELTNRSVSWNVELLNPIENHTYQAVLLEDVDDDGVFSLGSGAMDAGEVIQTVAFSGTTATLSYNYPEDDFGAFSWKILVQDTTTNAAGSYSSITVFKKLEDQPKKQASILEIMPLTQKKVASGESTNPTAPDGHTFYLDKNYQQSSGNPFLYSAYGTAQADRFGYDPIPNDRTPDRPYASNVTDAEAFNANSLPWSYANGSAHGKQMGKYMTTLSVNRYDSAEGHEDRDYNYMDLVADEYDLSLDIMYMDDIEFYAKAARNTTDKQREEYANTAAEAYDLYQAYLTEGTVEYNKLKAVEDPMRQAIIDLRDGKGISVTYVYKDGSQHTYSGSDFNTYGLDKILNSRDYFRFFYLNNGDVGTGGFYPVDAFYFGYYKPYIEEHDKMVEAYRKYRHFSMMAYGPEAYLRKNYDVIVVGFMDDYGGTFEDFSEEATSDLLAFTEYKEEDGSENGGSLLMTHDNMTYYGDTPANASHALTLTRIMREEMAQNPLGHLIADESTGTTGFAKYSSTDTDRYFLTNLSANTDIDLSMKSTAVGSTWDSLVQQWRQKANKNKVNWASSGNGTIGLPGYTDVFSIYETNQGMNMKFTYTEFQIEEAIKYNMQVTGPLNNTGTAKATQVNRGVVTTYPFYIASDLRISNTHSQAYTLDLENEDVAVWYTLAPDSASAAGTSGGTNYQLMKENSSMYAASPKDGADNYYIYSVGNITYCGAGHALITGYQRDNNDERRLFLNVLINMASKTGKAPKKQEDIVLFDPDGTTKAPGNIVKRDADNGYYIDVTSGVAYPEFGFGIEKGANQTVTDVEIFYDLDYLTTQSDAWTDDENHIKVFATDDILDVLNSGGVYLVNKVNCPSLVTQRRYFDAYGGQYTYLVVRVTIKNADGSTKVLSKRIKVLLTKDLLDLT